MKIALATWASDAYKKGDVATVIKQACLADQKGIDQFDFPDHVTFVDEPAHYPYGKVPVDLGSQAFFEPLTLLSAIASVTSNMRLATGILITPLRQAVFLAKQVATLDCISNGRVDFGIGVGWLKEEYDACNVPWEGRMEYMLDQVRVCRALWTQLPATVRNKAASFDKIYSVPLPAQRGGPPVLLGIAGNERNFERIADVGDGWHAPPTDCEPEKLATQIAALRSAFAKRGRRPGSCIVKAHPRAVFKTGEVADLAATVAQLPALEAAGVDICYFGSYSYIRNDEEFEGFVDRLMELCRQL